MPRMFPDYPATVVRKTDAGSEMVLMRWGMPPPPRTGGRRSPTSATLHRRTGAVGSSRRTGALSQPTASPNTRPTRTRRPRKRDVVWFALNEDRPLSPRHQVKAGVGATSGLRLPDDRSECSGGADPPQGHAGDPDDRGPRKTCGPRKACLSASHRGGEISGESMLFRKANSLVPTF